MNPAPSLLERFIRWFVVPLNVLKMIPNGDGAFVALSIGCFLCERYYRTLTRTQEQHWKKDFLGKAAEDLNVETEFFESFWNMFRHGMQHQASPKVLNEAHGTVSYRWRISDKFSAIPTRCTVDGVVIVCIDPWKFADLMVSKIVNNSDVLSDAITHSFGNIFELDATCQCEDVPWISVPPS